MRQKSVSARIWSHIAPPQATSAMSARNPSVASVHITMAPATTHTAILVRDIAQADYYRLASAPGERWESARSKRVDPLAWHPQARWSTSARLPCYDSVCRLGSGAGRPNR
jgi:hypothetical protein